MLASGIGSGWQLDMDFKCFFFNSGDAFTGKQYYLLIFKLHISAIEIRIFILSLQRVEITVSSRSICQGSSFNFFQDSYCIVLHCIILM